MTPSSAEEKVEVRSSGDSDVRGELRLVNYKVDQLTAKIDSFIQEVKGNYVTKSELGAVNEKISKIENNIGWLVKTVLGVVVVAILGLVIVKAGGRP